MVLHVGGIGRDCWFRRVLCGIIDRPHHSTVCEGSRLSTAVVDLLPPEV